MTQAMDKLYSAAQVRELDRRVIEDHGVPGFQLMGRAAEAAFLFLRQRWPHARNIAVFCGPGNNGGDGFLIAQLALQAGFDVRLYFLGQREAAKGDAASALDAFESAGGVIESFGLEQLPQYDVVVDALLGTGLGRGLKADFRAAVQSINACRSPVLAVDIPSGIDADTGKVWGVAVRAQATATFIGRKLGLYTGAGSAHAGAVKFFDLSAPAAVYADMPHLARCVTQLECARALPARPADAHKGSHGHVLCVGGNHGMGGAVRMAAEAALRVGAGLVSVATHAEHTAAMTQARPELMCRGVAEAKDLDVLTAAAGAIAVGPGLGQDAWARALFARVLELKQPLVVDADALNLLAAEPCARGNWILTPHPGEAARLLGWDTSTVQADRPAAVSALVERFNAVVVLKGAGSLIKAPDGALFLCEAGNPGMATGGMGDVLTGVIASLVAQGLGLDVAARIGVYLHAIAGDAAAVGGERGLLPSDLFPQLRRLANPA